jgi:hypothetical protein
VDASNPERCLCEALHSKIFEILFCESDEGSGVAAVQLSVCAPVGAKLFDQMSDVFFMTPPRQPSCHAERLTMEQFESGRRRPRKKTVGGQIPRLSEPSGKLFF